MIGLTGYYQKFITSYADLVLPLMQLTHKTIPFIWMDQCQKAFKTMKDVLMKNPILVYPELNKPDMLFIDTSKYAWPVVLTQE